MRLAATLSLASAVLAGGCIEFVDLESREFTLTPQVIQVADYRHSYQHGVCFPFELERRGTGSGVFATWESELPNGASEELLVGYSSKDVRGESCHLWVHHVFDGLVHFDMDELPEAGVVTLARLRFRDPPFSRSTFPASDLDTVCPYEVGTAREDWRGRAVRRTTMPETFLGRQTDQIAPFDPAPPARFPSGEAIADVTSTVVRWREGVFDNFGFIISPFDALEYRETDSFCARQLQQLELVITMDVPVGS